MKARITRLQVATVTVVALLLVVSAATAGVVGASGVARSSTDDVGTALSASGSDDANISISHQTVTSGENETFTRLVGFKSTGNFTLDNGTNYHVRVTNEDSGSTVKLALHEPFSDAETLNVSAGNVIGMDLYSNSGEVRERPYLFVFSGGAGSLKVVNGSIPEASGTTNISVALLNATTGAEIARTDSEPHVIGYTGTLSQNSTDGNIRVSVPRDVVPKGATVRLTLSSAADDDRHTNKSRTILTYDSQRDAFTTVLDASEYPAEDHYWTVRMQWQDAQIIDFRDDDLLLGGGPAPALSVGPSAASVQPGSTFTLTYRLENIGAEDGNATSVAIAGLPANWSVASESGDWQGQSNSWVSLAPVPANGQYRVNGTVTVPENASGEYTITADGFVTPNLGDTTRTTVDVSEFSAANYDTDGDGSVAGDTQGVLQGIADYNEGDLSLSQVLEVISAYNS